MSEATVTRARLGDLIASRIDAEADGRASFEASGGIRHLAIDDLLPADVARRIGEGFPHTSEMVRNRKLREDKYVSAQLNRHDPLVEEAVYGFQSRPVLDAVERATGISGLQPDDHLYAGGISSMTRGQFLAPHLDNSHDKDRQRWRVLNLLYYVTPDWTPGRGGSLELWPDGPRGRRMSIESRFNRLVIMETHEGSWHSVSSIEADGARNCVSNYYFRARPIHDGERYHVTSFRSWPGEHLRDLALRADTLGRALVRGVVGTRIIENPHVYRRDEEK